MSNSIIKSEYLSKHYRIDKLGAKSMEHGGMSKNNKDEKGGRLFRFQDLEI